MNLLYVIPASAPICNGDEEAQLNELELLVQLSLPELLSLMQQIGYEGSLSRKRRETIKKKIRRPDTRLGFRVRNVPDALRFRLTLVDLLEEFPCVHGKLLSLNLVEVDFSRFVSPGKFGWRGANYILRLSTGLLAECQILPREISEVQNLAQPLYEICREIDKRWGTADQLATYERVRQESIKLYDDAWSRYLARTLQTDEQIADMLSRLVERSN